MWETKTKIAEYLNKEGYFRAFYYIMQVMRTNAEKSNNEIHQDITLNWGIKVLDKIESFVIDKYNLNGADVYAVTKFYDTAFWEESNKTYKQMKERLKIND